jgi:hypothetical protein
MQRCFDAARINALVNDPSIRPHIGGDGKSVLDLTAAVADRQNVFVLGEHGGFAFTWSAPRTYEVHTFILPEGRGPAALEMALTTRGWMQEHFADHLWTMVHPDAANVRRFTLAAGFRPAGERTVDLGQGPVTYDLFDWRA